MMEDSSSAATAAADSGMSRSAGVKRSPAEFLKQVIGKPVTVKLHSGVTYRGVLACLDGFMNIAMEQTEEYVDGQLKNKYGDCFIRGNNGKDATIFIYLSLGTFIFIPSILSMCFLLYSSLYQCGQTSEIS